MYKMHENQYYQRFNLPMSTESMNSSSSQISHKKNPFYHHDQPDKLNYYARFSPNRKKTGQQFQSCILEGTSPLSPRSSKSSSFSKKKSIPSKIKHKKTEVCKIKSQKINLIDESDLLAINQMHTNRNEIYIDQEEQSEEGHEQQQSISISKKLFKNDDNFLKDQQSDKIKVSSQESSYPANESINKRSQLQQSSSFERIIEPSSSEDNQINYIPKVSTGFQMRIEDDDSEDQAQNQPHKGLKPDQDNIVIVNESEEKIFELAQSIGSVKRQNKWKHETRQVKSQNVSFSIDSDLSMIEEKWNSYFEVQNDQSDQNDEHQKQQNLFSENISQISHNPKSQAIEQLNPRKMSQSSDGDLPSFSNPDSSSYIRLEPSRPQSIYDVVRNQQRQMNQEQKKQFKRQYTFGNELNAALPNDETHQNKIQTQKSLPLFIKFLSKQTISGFTKAKGKNFKNQNKKETPTSKADITQKLKVPRKPYIPVKITSKLIKQKQKNHETTVLNETKIIIQQPNEAAIGQKVFINNQILIEEDPSQSDQQLHSQTIQDEVKTQNQTIKKPMVHPKNQDWSTQVTFRAQISPKKDTQIVKSPQSSIEKVNWQQKIIKMLEKQQNQHDDSEIIPKNNQEIIHQDNNDSQLNEYQQSQIQFQPEQVNLQRFQRKEKDGRTIKQQPLTGYAQIYSKKFLYTGKAKTQLYHDKFEQSLSNYHDSDYGDSQNYGQRYPKGSQGQSLTTATQQLNLNTLTFYSPKKRSNGIEQVENLKKYLMKMEQSPKFKGKQETSAKFSINQSIEELETQRSSLPDYAPFQAFGQFNLKQGQSTLQPELQNQLKTENCKQKNPQSALVKVSQDLSSTQKQPQTFGHSLRMLEDLIPTLPRELISTYEKIYTHVYEQELKYKKKIEKQRFLLSFMDQFVKGEKQKIDCEGFLGSEISQLQSKNEMKFSCDEEELQIFINKHIILALVRNLAAD